MTNMTQPVMCLTRQWRQQTEAEYGSGPGGQPNCNPAR